MTDKEPADGIYASLIIRGQNLDPKMVTDLLRLEATRSFKRGDTRKNGQKWPHGFWEFGSKGSVNSPDLRLHLEWLLERIERVTSELATIINTDGIHTEIDCLWIMPSEHENLSLSSKLIQKIASLGIELNIDVYSTG